MSQDLIARLETAAKIFPENDHSRLLREAAAELKRLAEYIPLYASPLSTDAKSVRVPREPTPEMQEAGRSAGFTSDGDLKRSELLKIVRKIYRAMLSASKE